MPMSGSSRFAAAAENRERKEEERAKKEKKKKEPRKKGRRMSEITYLNYVGVERFYQEAKRKRLDFICIDVGSKVSGLAITIVSQRSSLTM
ncbi:hypothetical protein Q3G72_005819 [Acer saccharum]|nr:hypothetical protein Q3G72_005819 [Acer saccharum]